MELSLNKIGIVDKAVIKLDGLTVISGSNNSGKTTVGKALYSVVDAAEDLDEKVNQDLVLTLQKYLDDCINEIDEVILDYEGILLLLDYIDGVDEELKIEQFLHYIQEKKHSTETDKKAIIRLFKKVKESINTDDYLDNMLRSFGPDITICKELIESWKKHSVIVLRLCDEALEIANADISKDSFAKRLIQKTLTTEFFDQIQPLVQNPNDQYDFSRITLTDGEKSFCNIAIDENRVDFKESVFTEIPFERVYFVDDPFTVDDMPVLVMREKDKKESLAVGSVNHHRDKLRSYMHARPRETSISEQLYREEKLRPITEKMDSVVPGRLTGGTYVERGMKLNASNLATGSKAFSILKKLLENGELDSKTLLILDEPESHLHPEWINKLAEVIVMLVKETRIIVLLTTHSPNFLLAVDAYMRQYDIREQCHFYQTERLTDRFGVRYVEKTDSLDEIYADFARAFAEMNALRKSLIWQEDEE